jgi:hypothetical protein
VRVVRRLANEHIADGDARAIGESPQLRGEVLVLERPEPVEERLEHDGRDERHEEDEECERGRGRQGPPARERVHEPDRRSPDERSEHELDRLALRPVGEPAAERLRREPEAALAQQAAPQVERQAGRVDRREDDDSPDGGVAEPSEPAERKPCEGSEDGEHED